MNGLCTLHSHLACVFILAGPLTIQEALTYLGGAVASTTGLAVGGTLLALLRKRLRKKGKYEGAFLFSVLYFGVKC